MKIKCKISSLYTKTSVMICSTFTWSLLRYIVKCLLCPVIKFSLFCAWGECALEQRSPDCLSRFVPPRIEAMLASVPILGGTGILLVFFCIDIKSMPLTLLPCYRSTYDLMRILYHSPDDRNGLQCFQTAKMCCHHSLWLAAFAWPSFRYCWHFAFKRYDWLPWQSGWQWFSCII